MSFYGKAGLLPRRFRLVLASFLQRPGLPFADALGEEAIQKAFDDEDASFADDQEAVYTPAITLWAFLSQVLFKGEQRSCVAAVARVAVLLVALERGPCSSNTGAFCRARGKLSEKVIHRIVVHVADGCEGQVDAGWLWHDRHVYLVDGTTVSMPDTPANQKEYPPNAPAAGRARFSDRPPGGPVVAGHRNAEGHGPGAVHGQRDGGPPRSHRATRGEASSEASRLTQQAARPSSRGTTRRETTVSPCQAAGSAIRS